MTWKEFKEAVESKGINDDDQLWYIDCGDLFCAEGPDITARPARVGGFGWTITS